MGIYIAGQRFYGKVRAKTWMRHAAQCGIDQDTTIELVRETARQLPETLAQARSDARSEDENRLQGSVDLRCEALIAGARRRAQELEAELARIGEAQLAAIRWTMPAGTPTPA